MEANMSGLESAELAAADGYPWQVKLALMLVLPLLILWTVIGNVLVCVAVCLVPKIRSQPYTVLYVSLAVADLFVAVLVMPIALLYLCAGTWRFGRTLCDVFVCADVLSCTASILNLCAISVDRYLAITDPLQYSQRRVEKLMALYVGVVWGGAICISIIPIVIIGNEHGADDMCTVSQNVYYQVWATVMSFYLPLAVMIFVYVKILKAARIIVRQERRAQGLAAADSRASVAELRPGKARPRLRCPWSLSVPREKKASVTLGIIMTAFIVCWLPFFLLAVIRPLVPRGSIPNSVSDVFLWLGYLNSLLNPIIYATFNRDFRRPFREILCLRCRSLKPLLRQEQYQEQYGCSQASYSQAIQLSQFDAFQLPLVGNPREDLLGDSVMSPGVEEDRPATAEAAWRNSSQRRAAGTGATRRESAL
ncbi:5-hydroxytryptamine receptor 1-like [Pollicipes pollicipes]|uniref:5-hydroxytryptamine receptor 1-like n=1 Tax=Pollicipes pollicipes TaxID=41117 RepID=UPI001884D4D8|nr:5-hydroxytryptamine receptor 1-like [Pollicipes pollicipes]